VKETTFHYSIQTSSNTDHTAITLEREQIININKSTRTRLENFSKAKKKTTQIYPCHSVKVHHDDDVIQKDNNLTWQLTIWRIHY